jgi:hypothetical protein
MLISRKFNTQCFLAIVATWKPSAMGAGTCTAQRAAVSFSHSRMNTGSLLKIESIGQ